MDTYGINCQWAEFSTVIPKDPPNSVMSKGVL